MVEKPGVTYYLEAQTASQPIELKIANLDIDIFLARVGDQRQCQRMYVGVGGAWGWKSRLSWGDRDWSNHLERNDVQIWILKIEGKEAGYYELKMHSDLSVEILYFGLLQPFFGKGLGGLLIQHSIVRGRAMGARRVWLKTSSTDHPNALNTYLRQGMKIVEKNEFAPAPRQDPVTEKAWEATVLGVLHNNPWFSVLLQSVRRTDGLSVPYYTIHHDRPAVGIVVRDEHDRYLLIRQHRFLINQFVWAIPSGGVEENESPEEAAARELKEETGYSCAQWRQLPGYFPTYGCSNQRFELFLAESPSQTKDSFDENEVVEIRWFSRAELIQMLLRGEIVDGLSLVPLLHLFLLTSLEKDSLADLKKRDVLAG